jgi:hypothetical protein
MTVDADGRPLTELRADASLTTLVGDAESWMQYLVKSSLPWYYVGVTHDLDQPHRREKLESARIDHHGGGGSPRARFERDTPFWRRTLREIRTTRPGCFVSPRRPAIWGDSPKPWNGPVGAPP